MKVKAVLLAFVLMLLLPGTFRVQAQAVHDVAVVDVATVLPYGATEVYPDWKVNITVVVRNEGTVAETFNVTAYCNSTVIDAKTVADLAPGENETLTFIWIAPPTAWWDFFLWTWILSPANYTIRAEADVVGGETDTGDNVFIDGSVKVRIPGDTNGDGVVDVSDVAYFAHCYKTEYPYGYCWRCDFNGDGVVDGRDLGWLLAIYQDTNIIPAVRDVAIVDASVTIPWDATEVYPGWLVNITVVARNWGNVPETFNVTAYANTTDIGTQSVTNLVAGTQTTLSFIWDTTSFSLGYYTISANASVVPGEIDPSDNTFEDGTVKIMEPPPPVIAATIDINPDTLNLRSKGDWITCYIELPEGYNASDIDIYSVRLNNTFHVSLLVVPPVPVPTEIGDYDDDTISDLMVKFNRTTLTSHIYHTLDIKYGNVTLTISGNLTDGTQFEGKDTVKVMFGGDVNGDGYVGPYDHWLFSGALGNHLGDPYYHLQCDFNGDTHVGSDDHWLFAGNYGATVPPQP